MTLVPRAADEGFVALYRFSEDGKALALHHRTPLDGIPSALAGFKGKLLAGVGKGLRLYMCGKKKLLKKCENKRIPNFVVTIETLGDRIYVGDVAERGSQQRGLLYLFGMVLEPPCTSYQAPAIEFERLLKYLTNSSVQVWAESGAVHHMPLRAYFQYCGHPSSQWWVYCS